MIYDLYPIFDMKLAINDSAHNAGTQGWESNIWYYEFGSAVRCRAGDPIRSRLQCRSVQFSAIQCGEV